jgi:hypothetical protein
MPRKVGRKEKFKGKSIVISSRVPKDSKQIYKIEIDKIVYNLAKERNDLKTE